MTAHFLTSHRNFNNTCFLCVSKMSILTNNWMCSVAIIIEERLFNENKKVKPFGWTWLCLSVLWATWTGIWLIENECPTMCSHIHNTLASNNLHHGKYFNYIVLLSFLLPLLILLSVLWHIFNSYCRNSFLMRRCRGRDRIVVRFTITYTIIAYYL